MILIDLVLNKFLHFLSQCTFTVTVFANFELYPTGLCLVFYTYISVKVCLILGPLNILIGSTCSTMRPLRHLIECSWVRVHRIPQNEPTVASCVVQLG